MASSTAVYIDGNNLYYGRLRGTRFKWLDVVALFEGILRAQDPSARIALVRYFSAPCLARFASHGRESEHAHSQYMRALQTTHGSRVSISLGAHAYPRTGALLPRFVEGVPFDRHDRVRVWKVEEKRTDVKLALSLYRDAASGHYAQQVVCSNDSDIEPALAAVREDFPGIRVGVVIPRPPATDPSRSHRNALSALSSLADWTRHHVLDPELDAAQLPLRVATRKRPILKPAHW